jgi:CRISPR system Cascade subunit CasE
MYLSRLILNPASLRVMREVGSPYEMHRTLMGAYPDELAPGQERVLFRVDGDLRRGWLAVLVQSLKEPDWSDLQAEASDYLLPLPAPNPEVKPFRPAFARGQILVFRLRANPTVKRQGRRWGLVDETEQGEWLRRKAAGGGFQILQARARQEDPVGGKIQRVEEAHTLKLISVRFDGVLRVVEPEAFLRSVAYGIGSGKAFGFGLLSLAVPL